MLQQSPPFASASQLLRYGLALPLFGLHLCCNELSSGIPFIQHLVHLLHADCGAHVLAVSLQHLTSVTKISTLLKGASTHPCRNQLL